MASQSEFVDFDADDALPRLCTVARETPGTGLFKRQLAGRGRFGHVGVVLGPHPGIHGYRFSWSQATSHALPHAFMRGACLAGVKRALIEPLSDGRRLMFVAVSVVDGSYHETDSDEQSVEQAAYLAVRNAVATATLVDV
jgi:elongation factor G